MARRKGVSLSTFYREWRRLRSSVGGAEPISYPVLLDAGHPGVIRREALGATLAAEHEAELAAVRMVARPMPSPTYEDLRSVGKSDLQARRELAGLTLHAVASSAGISPTALGQIENGTRKPSPDLVDKLNACLNEARRSVVPGSGWSATPK